MSESTPEIEGVPLADKVNVEPPIFNGLSASEAAFVCTVSGVVFVTLGVILWATTGFWFLFVTSAVGGPLGVIWVTSKHLEGIKRNRPDGYHIQALRIALAKRGLGRNPFIRRTGWWSIGRTL